MSGAWLEGGVQTSTKSRPVTPRRSSTLSNQRAPGSRATASLRRAGSRSLTATISTPSLASQPGTWPSSATLPSPMMAPRSILPEPVLPRDGAQGLVEGRQRIAAVARRTEARIGPWLGGGDDVARDHAAQREAAADPLADGHDVGDHALVLGPPHRARAAEAGDHLVGDEQRAVLAGDGLDRGQEAGRGDDVAGGALDRLDDDGGDL